MSRLLVLALALVLSLMGHGEAAAGRATVSPILKESVTVSANGPSWIRVRIPKKTILRADLQVPRPPNPGVEIEANDFGAAALIPEDAKGTIALALPSPRGFDLGTFVWATGRDMSFGSATLSPGMYRLAVLVPPGKFARVHLKFSGLERGRQVLRASNRQYFVVEQDSIDSAGAGSLRFSSGATALHPVATLAFQAALARHDVHAATLHEACFYKGKPMGPAPYAPGCPGVTHTVRVPHVNAYESIDGLTHGLFASNHPFEPGDNAQGYSMTTATPARLISYYRIWLQLPDTFLPEAVRPGSR